MGELKAGVIYGVTSWTMQCRNCGYQGQPLIFDSQEDYDKFREGLKESGSAPIPETEEEKPDERIVDLLEHTKDVKEAPEPPSKSWRREILVSLIIATIITLIEAPSSFALLGSIAVLYLVFFFVLAAVVVLVLFIVVEYVMRKMRHESVKKQGGS
jgi:hypothetical protein